jgi:hypothetical protein
VSIHCSIRARRQSSSSSRRVASHALESADVHTMAIVRSRRFDCFPPMARATSFAGVGIRIAIDRESHRIPTSTRSRRARPSVARRRARARGRAIFLGET